MKTCSKCEIEKSLIEFHRNKNYKDGLQKQCKECFKKYAIKNADKRKQYLIKNADKIRQQNSKCCKQYYLENIDKIKQYGKQYRIDNDDKIKQRDKEYRQSEHGKLIKKNGDKEYRQSEHGKLMQKAFKHRRRALIKNNTFGKHWTPTDIILKLKLQHGKCVYCEANITDYYEIDHFIPLVKGGSNEAWNIQLLCKECNRGIDGKFTKDAHEYAQKHGKLI